ncbi:MAG: hypothetical protein HN617_09205 [Planctomycetaceae bacterium]|jgi:hypothetical protein|nr:hypothetical protein [Planctomycetaceae bacterium]MBT5125621.1 hypothetical protein [Planctomycetaceae bacterium]MBT5598591.1 hypothetical protein [Planctomycetaceae bacterium]MBT5884534.1 hypothetical protein [Planctomycetaceae bacterium]MBT6847703.1 hypothetical protein [Planctomycetaceae bacterium]
MEGFNVWWIIWAAVSVISGVLVAVIMAITMNRKGRIALFMVPLVAWQILWMSWQALRSSVLLGWIIDNGYSTEWYQVSFLVSNFFSWIFIFLALVPAMVKDKPASTSDADRLDG